MMIGMDVGTSFVKGAVLDLDQGRLHQIQRVPFPDPLPGLHPLWHEVDPHAIVSAVREVLRRLLPHAPQCRGILMSGQMGGLIFANAQGEPLSNYISWLDSRLLMPHPSGAGTYFDVLSERLTPTERSRLGNEHRPGLLLSFLFWLAETGQLPAADARPVALADFLVAHLCQTAPVVEPTSATGALDLTTMDWPWDIFQKLGVDQLAWPAIGQVTDPVGQAQLEGQPLVCYPAVGDHQCALAGAFLDFGELSLNISTGSQVALLTAQLETGEYRTRPFFDGRYLNTFTNIPAGRALNVLVDLLTELVDAQNPSLQDPWPYIIEAAGAVPETDLEVNLAFFPSPVGDQGAITHIREENLTVGHLFRAAFENMASNYYTLAHRLSPTLVGQRLVFSGGLALKIDLLREMILEKFQMPYRLCVSTEDTLLGLLVLALVVDGRAGSVRAAGELLQHVSP